MSIDWKYLIEPVADRLLSGERYRNYGDARRYGTHGSLAVHTTGPQRGTWYDSKDEKGGDVLDLIQHRLGTDEKGALKWLDNEGLVKPSERHTEPPLPVASSQTAALTRENTPPPPAPPRPAPTASPPPEPAPPEDPGPAPSRSRTAHVATAVLAASVPISGTPGAAYLAGRGTWPTDTGPLPGCVRWLPPAVLQLPGWETDRGRMAQLTPPQDLTTPHPSPHVPPPPGGWPPPVCGAVVWLLQRPGEEPDAVEVEAVNAEGQRPEKWKRTV